MLTSEARLTVDAEAKAKAKIIKAQKQKKNSRKMQSKNRNAESRVERPPALQLRTLEPLLVPHFDRHIVRILIDLINQIRPRAHRSPRLTACSFNDIHVTPYSNINIYIYI